MPSIQDYWRKVREIEADLPEGDDVFVTSLDDPRRGLVGGVVSEVKAEYAARMIVDGSAVAASAEEVAAYHVDQRLRKADGRAAAEKAIGRMTAVLPATDAPKKKPR
jgi:hypothetical protein